MIKFIENISIRETNNKLIMVYHKIEGTLFELNETGSDIVRVIQKGVKSSEDIVKLLMEVYDATYEEMLEEVNSFLKEFIEYKILIME